MQCFSAENFFFFFAVFGHITSCTEVHSPLGISESLIHVLKCKIRFSILLLYLFLSNLEYIFRRVANYNFSIRIPNLNVYSCVFLAKTYNSVVGMTLLLYASFTRRLLADPCQTTLCVYASASFPDP